MTAPYQPGPRNLITDIAGMRVGNAGDAGLKSGVTVLTGDQPFTCGVHVMGGAPGTRETDLLAPDRLVQQAHALVLSGGSAFGLDAASGVADALAAKGIGFPVGPARVPIVPAAILFDLLNGGDKDWAVNPYRALGAQALADAGAEFALGTAGAGIGATCGNLKGGLGSASLVLPSGHRVGALVAANPVGNVTVGTGAQFWAAPFEIGDEFGALGIADQADPAVFETALHAHHNTTIAIVATDADLTQAQATRMATAAHDGMARAIMPSHTPFDGDLIFAAATGEKPLGDGMADILAIGHAAALTLARAIARAVYLARPAKGDSLPSWSERFAGADGIEQ